MAIAREVLGQALARALSNPDAKLLEQQAQSHASGVPSNHASFILYTIRSGFGFPWWPLTEVVVLEHHAT